MMNSNGIKRLSLFLLFLAMGISAVGCTADPMPKLPEPTHSSDKVLEQEMQQKQKPNPTEQQRAESSSKDRKKLSPNKVEPNKQARPVTILPPNKPIRAIYVTANVANSERMNSLIDLVNQTELNAMVIDINSGITISSPVKEGNKYNYTQLVPSNKRAAQHFRKVIQQLKQNQIYLIARIVTFKNPTLAEAMPNWAMKRKDGQLWRDRSGTLWIDPYRQEAWEYPIALAEQAAKLGFDEIQFDYVRMPENAEKVDREVAYANEEGWSKSEVIGKFLHQANLRLHKMGVRVSADVFGMVGSTDDDMGIGQKWDEIVKEVDVISPMVYPSHYSEGIWGIKHPDLNPGPIIKRALEDTAKRNRKLNQKGIATAAVRPWLQSFTAGWIHPHQKYGAAQIREQIVAARKAGFQSYMLWNSANRYPKYTT